MFLLDTSASVGGDNFERALLFVNNVIASLDVDSGKVQVALVTYSADVKVHYYLNEHPDHESLLEATSIIKYTYGRTQLPDGLKRVRMTVLSERYGDRPTVKNIVVIVTDGETYPNLRKTINEGRRNHNAENHIFVVSVGYDGRELRRVATPPYSSNLVEVATYDDLESVRERIAESICEGAALI